MEQKSNPSHMHDNYKQNERLTISFTRPEKKRKKEKIAKAGQTLPTSIKERETQRLKRAAGFLHHKAGTDILIMHPSM